MSGVFLFISRMDNLKLNNEIYLEYPSRTVTNFLEGLLGVECCVDFV